MSYYPYSPYYMPPYPQPQYIPKNRNQPQPIYPYPLDQFPPFYPHYPPYFPSPFSQLGQERLKTGKQNFEQCQVKIQAEKDEQGYQKLNGKNGNQLTQMKNKKGKKNTAKVEFFALKTRRDQEYNVFEPKKPEKKNQKEGRNNNSNVFRAFVKLIISEFFQGKLKIMFEKIKAKNDYEITFEKFQDKLKSNLPKFTNYINNRQFRRLYRGQSEFNKCLRIMFHHFQANEGFSHILTIAYKDRIKKENLQQFMHTLHGIEEVLRQ